jgi:hypothetical protein
MRQSPPGPACRGRADVGIKLGSQVLFAATSTAISQRKSRFVTC